MSEFISIAAGLFIIWLGVFLCYGRKNQVSTLEERLNLGQKMKNKKALNIPDIIKQEEKKGFIGKLQREIKQARLTISVNYIILAMIILSVAFVGILAAIFKSPICLIGIVLGIMVPRSFLKKKQEKFQDTFNTEMTKALKRMSATLRINDSVDLALKDVVTSPLVPEIVRKEFGAVYAAIQVGTPISESFYKLYESVPTNEVLYLCVALDIQFNAGGDKSDILDDICDQIFEKNNIKESAKSSVAEMMLTAKLMSCLPLVFLCILGTSNAGLVEFYTSTAIGQIVAIFIAGLVICGYKIINKMAKINI